MRARRFGQIGPALLLVAILTAGSASAYYPYDPRNCIGFDWDDKRALVVQKVTAMCKGKAYFTTPQNLGQYLLMDYMSRKMKTIH